MNYRDGKAIILVRAKRTLVFTSRVLLAVVIGVTVPWTAASAKPSGKIAKSCDEFVMSFTMEGAGNLRIQRAQTGSYELDLLDQDQTAAMNVVSDSDELSEIAKLLRVDSVGRCVLSGPSGGLYVRLPVGTHVYGSHVVETGYLFVELGVSDLTESMNRTGQVFVADIKTIYPQK